MEYWKRKKYILEEKRIKSKVIMEKKEYILVL
jgi:hypothetical protein